MELAFGPQDLRGIADHLLELSPDPVPRVRLLRDVLGLSRDEPRVRQAMEALDGSRWVRLLEESQLPEGTWGRFHSEDTRAGQPVPTTQVAVRIALDCGLDTSGRILGRLMPTLLEYVQGSAVWPDTPEKHDNPDAWWIWVRHYSASVLAEIEPMHPALDGFWRIWATALEAAFATGTYDRGAEVAILNDLLGCRMKNPVPFHAQPPLEILGATRNHLPPRVEHAMLEHVLHLPCGILYVYGHALVEAPGISDRGCVAWIRGHRLLSRFRLWREHCVSAMNRLWEQRDEEGMWDLGPGAGRKPQGTMPLSESWRLKGNRRIDSTTEILTLLNRLFVEPARPLPGGTEK